MHALVISVLSCTSYSLGRESKLLVERTVDLLSSFPGQSVKVQLAGWYTQKNKYSLNMGTPSTCTKDHHCPSRQATSSAGH